jgi:hypothetical protein
MKKTFLLLTTCALVALNAMAQDTPEADQKYRIINGSGFYLTCDPEWSDTGWNLFFLDSLYTVPVSEIYTIPYVDRAGEEITLNTTPEKQIFTLVNPDPNDPEVWAIEAANGQYLSIDTRNTWDVTLTGTDGGVASLDDAGAQVFLEDQGYGIYLIRFNGTTGKYFAADHTTEGISVGKYNDGWEYAARSFIYRDKPVTQETVYWYFEKAGGGSGSGIKNPAASQKLTIFPSAVRETLNVQVEKGTKISVYSVAGIKVLSTTVDGALNVSSLTPGVYVVSTPSGAKAKFIKQ